MRRRRLRLRFEPKARKQLRDMPPEEAQRVVAALDYSSALLTEG